jgi:hypothetical protein
MQQSIEKPEVIRTIGPCLIETPEICSYLGISPETLKRYVALYPQMPVKKLGGRYKANPDDLREFVRNFLMSKPEGTAPISKLVKGGRKSNPAANPPRGGWQIKDPSERDSYSLKTV